MAGPVAARHGGPDAGAVSGFAADTYIRLHATARLYHTPRAGCSMHPYVHLTLYT